MRKANKHLVEATVLAACGVAVVVFLSSFDGLETLYAYTRSHELLELDEVFLSVPVLLCLMLLFVVRRVRELGRTRRGLEAANRELVAAREETRRMQRAKEQFLGYALHEVKGPLGGVLSALEILEADAGEKELARLARDAGRSLQTGIQGMLEIIRLFTSEQAPPAEEFPVRDLLREAVDSVRGQAGAKGLSLSLSLDPGIPESAVGHAAVVRHVVLNLTDNAVKFTERGGVSVRCALGGEEGETLLVAVSDSGPGIPWGMEEALFEPYRQGAPPRGEAHGVGLGLSIVKRLVDSLGGSVSARNRPEGGAVFEAVVPLRPAVQPSA